MKFENPYKRRLNKNLKNNNINKTTEEVNLNNEKTMLTDEITNTIEEKQNIQIEDTNYPNVAMLTGSPRCLEVNINALGYISGNYDERINNIQKTM